MIRETLQRRAGALRLGHQRHDLREQAVRAEPLRDDQHRAILIQRGAHHPIARGLVDRQRFAREHGFIETRAAFEDAAIHRNFLSRPDTYVIAWRQ